MAGISNRSSKQSTSSRSGRKKASTGKIVRITLILLVVIAIAVLVWWFLPNIVSWFGNTWEYLMTNLGAGIILIGIAIAAILVILLADKYFLFWKYWHECLGSIFLFFLVWGILAYISPSLGGNFGTALIGSSSFFGILILLGLLFAGIFLIIPKWTARQIYAFFRFLGLGIKKLSALTVNKITTSRKSSQPKIKKQKSPVKIEEPQLAEKPESPQPAELTSPKFPITIGGWQLPHPSMLDKPVETEISQSDVDKRAELITESLASYGVDAKVVQINIGPTVTQYGVEPGWDRKFKEIKERDRDGNVKTKQQEISKTRVKVERISSLANDLALALAAPSIRIEAPVPGKSIVGVEVPNTTFGSVNLRSIIESPSYQKMKTKSKLAIPLGKGPGGEVLSADLSKMPHLLIAGSTGSGKTVFLNSMICCLLFYNTPDDINFIMIDPKRVELVSYNGLPHLIAPVVVDAAKAVTSLQWLTDEMDKRYRLFAEAGARNIESYNKDKAPGSALPYIILVIDELADLMMTAFGEVEHALCRLAQLARATGIHLIVATQRPSVDVITGLIKANFPTRISFSLTSQIDSRTILDSPGAEKLLGRGDMLYMPTDAAKPKRLQGPFLSDAEIDKVVKFWSNQPKQARFLVDFDQVAKRTASDNTDEDELLEEARQLAIEHNTISSSFLQRKLKIGYPRAARIMERLKEEGFESSSNR